MSLNDIFNFLTSVGTVAMAITTGWVILQNKKHHQNSFRPICVLVPEQGVDPGYFRSEILKCQETAANDPSNGKFEIHCALKNIGVGPALNVNIKIRIPLIAGYCTSMTLSPLARDESRGGDKNPLLISVTFRDGFSRTDFELATNQVWEIFIEYQDCFGNIFHTRHTKNPQKPWSTISEGPITAIP